jgi:hypothetical protein
MQEEACLVFEEIEGHGFHLEQVVIMEHRLEGPITEKMI